MCVYAKIWVEVDVEKGLLEAICLSLDNWTHAQQLDYEQLPFKCKIWHEYGHFAKNCKKNQTRNQASTYQGQT